jgi:hypothetical protein
MIMRTVSGPLTSRSMGDGAWQLSAARAEVYLRVGGFDVSELLQSADIMTLELHWREGGVTVTHGGGEGASYFEADTAIIHESRSRLYEALPLARFDADAQRFWRRVFALMRIPGGRLLLRFLARRNR